MDAADVMKRAVAERAVEKYVEDGMNIGLGTGSTASYAVHAVGKLVTEKGYRLKCVATSLATEQLAEECGIEIVSLNDIDHIDVTIDGADEVDPGLQLIKGLGGALLREKIVAASSYAEIIIVDESKMVENLGIRTPIPVEVLRFGHKRTAYGLERQGCTPILRMKNRKPFVTDGGNYIYDCKFKGISSPFFLESAIDSIPGVVESGLFLNTATVVLISHADGTITEQKRA